MATARFPTDGVARASAQRHGTVTLEQLREAKVSRGARRANVDAERWRDLPYHGVITDLGPDDRWRPAWVALTLLGPRARIGGLSALQVDGLELEVSALHVWVPKSTYTGARAKAPAGVRLHETRRWDAEEDCVPPDRGLPRSLPAVATLQAALWAPTLRAAQLALVAPVQQRLVRVEDLTAQLERIRRHPYRRPLAATLVDLAGGSQSMGELDFVRLCREHGLPEPSRQERRRGRNGTIFLDVYWEEYRVVAEINGAGHLALQQQLSDEIRAIDLQREGEAVVQVTTLTLRTDPDPFFRSLRELLVSRGCPL